MGLSVRLSISQSIHRHNLVSATPLTVFKGFWWNFPVMTWWWSYFTGDMLSWFLRELWSFVIFSTVSLVSATPLAVFIGFWTNLPIIVPMTRRGSYYTEVMLDLFCQSYSPFVSLTKSCDHNFCFSFHLGPVVQSIISLTSSLRSQLVKCFMTL